MIFIQFFIFVYDKVLIFKNFCNDQRNHLSKIIKHFEALDKITISFKNWFARLPIT